MPELSRGSPAGSIAVKERTARRIAVHAEWGFENTAFFLGRAARYEAWCASQSDSRVKLGHTGSDFTLLHPDGVP